MLTTSLLIFYKDFFTYEKYYGLLINTSLLCDLDLANFSFADHGNVSPGVENKLCI